MFFKLIFNRVDIVEADSYDKAIEAYRKKMIEELSGPGGLYAFSLETVIPIRERGENICGDRHEVYFCNLPKGHAESHQQVSSSGNGGSIGWANVD